MGKKYTAEKVLYFAAQEKRLHVGPSEEDRVTDLWIEVQRQVVDGCLEHIASDDSGQYFGITDKGQIKLLNMQIEWRKRNGKDVSGHLYKLKELREKAA
mgnify:CR=1 FL=1